MIKRKCLNEALHWITVDSQQGSCRKRIRVSCTVAGCASQLMNLPGCTTSQSHFFLDSRRGERRGLAEVLIRMRGAADLCPVVALALTGSRVYVGVGTAQWLFNAHASRDLILIKRSYSHPVQRRLKSWVKSWCVHSS